MKTVVNLEGSIPRVWLTLALGGSLVFASCSSGTGGMPQAGEPEGPPALSAPEAGHYVFVGSTAAGIRLGDTRSGRDTILAVTSGPIATAVASPRGRHVAIAHPRADSLIVSVVALSTGVVRRVRAVPSSAELSIVWAPDGARMGLGVRGAQISGVFVVDTAGQTRNTECSAADRVEAFRGADQLIVSDRANFYAVAIAGCRTLATFPGRGKSEVRYSPNGQRVTFLRDHQTAGRPELWLADYNGAQARVITSYNYQPSDVRWSLDGRYLAFEVQSQQYRNVTHVATYDTRSRDAEIGREETPLGVPRDFDPCWSPTSSHYAFARSYQRTGADGQPYETRQTVVRSIGSDASRVVSEDLVRGASGSGGACQWVDGTHLLVRSPGGHRIVNVESSSAYELPEWREVYAAFVP